MKLQYKTSLTMTVLFLILFAGITGMFDFYNHETVRRQVQNNYEDIAQTVANHAEVHLLSSADVSQTISSAPLLTEALIASNRAYESLDGDQRQKQIDDLDRQWQQTKDPAAPFIQAYLNTPAARYLSSQQDLFPGQYGEIFLTNRYGAMIATTGRLTTLAHGHKYWWQAAFAEGRGRIFFDDRGFDTSVGGYVLGVVVPIRNQGEIIGILKCNINLLGRLTHLLEDFKLAHGGELQIVRSSGLVVLREGLEPLSETLPGSFHPHLQKRVSDAFFYKGPDGYDQLIATTPIAITKGSDTYGFGGSYKSMDHIKGNTGEAWHVLISVGQELVYHEAHVTTRALVYLGLILLVFVLLISLYWGRWVARPVVELAQAARKIGAGHLETRVHEIGRDEIGDLARAINEMSSSLARNMASRRELEQEVTLRSKAQAELERRAIVDELTGAYNRRYFAEAMNKEIARAGRYGQPLSLLMFDIDHFKIVNDTHGHDAGDRVLIQLAELGMNIVREQDFFARWGGEEFVVILPQTDLAASTLFAERLRLMVEQADFKKPARLTISIGLAQLDSLEQEDDLLKRVDNALYKAKQSGRNCVVAG